MTDPFDLRRRASELQGEALRLIARTGIADLLTRRFGGLQVAGSVDFDLMVWPDIDLYVPTAEDGGGAFLSLLPELHDGCERAGLALVRAGFNDEYRRPENPYGRGLYLGLRVLDGDRQWKIDLWGWRLETFADKVVEHRRLAADLAGADRELVLAIKDAVHRRPEYRATLTSMDVYGFVLAEAGRTVEAFDAWVAARRK